MVYKEYVLETFPDAHVTDIGTSLNPQYNCYVSFSSPNYLGTGRSTQEAWKYAAYNLGYVEPVPVSIPEDWAIARAIVEADYGYSVSVVKTNMAGHPVIINFARYIQQNEDSPTSIEKQAVDFVMQNNDISGYGFELHLCFEAIEKYKELKGEI